MCTHNVVAKAIPGHGRNNVVCSVDVMLGYNGGGKEWAHFVWTCCVSL